MDGILYVIECKIPALTCCEHRLTSKTPADNVCRVKIYCSKWRENRLKDRVFCHCDKEYEVKE